MNYEYKRMTRLAQKGHVPSSVTTGDHRRSLLVGNVNPEPMTAVHEYPSRLQSSYRNVVPLASTGQRSVFFIH